jgi:hypothetical protein
MFSLAKMHQVKIILKLDLNAFVKLVPYEMENVLEDREKLRKKKSANFMMLLKMNHNRIFGVF